MTFGERIKFASIFSNKKITRIEMIFESIGTYCFETSYSCAQHLTMRMTRWVGHVTGHVTDRTDDPQL